MEAIHLISSANQMTGFYTGFYMKYMNLQRCVNLGVSQVYMIELELIVVNYFPIKAAPRMFVPRYISALKHAFVSSEYVYEIVFQVVLLLLYWYQVSLTFYFRYNFLIINPF